MLKLMANFKAFQTMYQYFFYVNKYRSKQAKRKTGYPGGGKVSVSSVMWPFNPPDCVKLFPHVLHLYDFFPSWTNAICLLMDF